MHANVIPLKTESESKSKYINMDLKTLSCFPPSSNDASCLSASLQRHSCFSSSYWMISLYHDISWHFRDLGLCTCSWAIWPNQKTHFSLFPLWKVPFNSRAITQCDALAALTVSPPRLTQSCGDGLCASCPSVGIAHKPHDSADRGSGDAGCEADLCVCMWKKKSQLSNWVTHRCLSQALKKWLCVIFGRLE